MRAGRVATLCLLVLSSCRQTMTVNTEASELIPSEVAVSKLQELLPTVDFVNCRSSKVRIEHKDLKDWKIDATGIGFHGQDNDQFHFQYADLRSTEFTRIPLTHQPIFEVALIMMDVDHETRELFNFNWADETRARQALELFEALRRKNK
jgi:hypothetical protein